MSKDIKSKKTKEIINSLKSKDQAIVMRAIKSSKAHGNPLIFEEILALLTRNSDEKIYGAIQQFMMDLKDSSTIEPLIEAISNKDFFEHKAMLISAFWNSPINPNQHISFFVNEAIQGDFMVAMESVTVLQNIESPFPEEEVNESLILLKDYFSQQKDDPKADLLKDALVVIREMENSVGLD